VIDFTTEDMKGCMALIIALPIVAFVCGGATVWLVMR